MLIFSHLSRLAAILGLLFSCFSIFIAYQRYYLVDQAIAIAEGDRNLQLGIQTLLGAIVLGTLAEISFSLRRRNNS